MKTETKCVQAGYDPKNGESRVPPIYQSTTFKYDTTEKVGDLFDLKSAGHFYARLSNPTAEIVEKKIAALEGGVGAMLTASGQSAVMIALLNICQAGDSIICGNDIYGGTYNLLSVTLKRLGITTVFVDPAEDFSKYIKDNTRAVLFESLTNPMARVLDIERAAGIAHSHGLPLIIDNTFPTPALLRPFEFGADIVVHSTSKYMDGHAVTLGGAIVDGGKFDWRNGKFPCMTTPDPSYHGLVYCDAFGEAAYITKARVQLMRDMGPSPQAMAAFLLNIGLDTLALRMERHSANALLAAQFLQNDDKVAMVNYPGLLNSPDHELAKKYLPKGQSGVVTFVMKGGKDSAVRFMDALSMIKIVVHVADARSCVLHPASATHRQLTDEQLKAAGINGGLIRLSVGIEHIDDIIADLEHALKCV